MATGARTATRVRKPRVGKFDPPSTDPANELEMRGLVILPREGYEAGKGWVTYEGWDVWILPSSTVDTPPRKYADGDIIPSDFLRIDGEEWQVDGPTAPYDKGSIRKGTRVRVKRVGS